MFSDIIVLDPSTIFQIYEFISCDTSCDCGHMPLYHSKEKEKENKENQKKIKIKYESSSVL